MDEKNSDLAVKSEDECLVFEEEDGKLNITGTADKLREMLGTDNPYAGGTLLQQIVNVINPGGENMARNCNTIIPILQAIGPVNELESMLAVQMIGVHYMTMEMMRRAMISDQTVEGVDKNVNRATKLNRSFIAQVEALNKLRGKGQQKMTVEHIHIGDGGQAVIANVAGGGKK